MELKKHPSVHAKLASAKDEVLSKVLQALTSVGLEDFVIDSISIHYKKPVKLCGPDEDLVWEPIETGEDDRVVYGWVCKPRT